MFTQMFEVVFHVRRRFHLKNNNYYYYLHLCAGNSMIFSYKGPVVPNNATFEYSYSLSSIRTNTATEFS